MPPLPVVALFGPTGVGKTEVAIALAELLRADGEDPVAVSADALQLYAGLEILTGAASAEDRARLEHRLLGILPLTATATAGDYARRAHAEIDGLVAAGRRPIVVGGTGLYLRAALAELELRPPPDPAIRARYAARLAAEGPRALHAELAERAPETAGRIDPNDAQRIARALELLDAGADPPGGSELWTGETRLPTLLVALTMERAALYARIDARADGDGRRRRRGRGPARGRRRRLAVGPPRPRLRRAAARRPPRDAAAHAPLRQAPAHVAAQAAGHARRST